MIYKFTISSEQVLQYSKEIAEKMGHNYVGTEHILYGLTKEKNGIASRVIHKYGITCELIVSKIEEMIGSNLDKIVVLGFTPRTKRVIENAYDEAKNANSEYIGTEHFLLGLLKEKDSIAVRILNNINISGNDIYKEIRKTVNEIDTSIINISSNNSENSYQSTKKLNQFSLDLTLMAQNGKIDPVIGRDNETQRVIEILSRRTKNNPCLIGDPGVGKTAIIEGLAQKIILRKCSRNNKK